jgi:hypothetical protein
MSKYTSLTRSGVFYTPATLRPDQLVVTDIFHSLAMQCRYNGHTAHFYSVAQHSWLLSLIVGDNRELQKVALLHDAAEAYIGDIVLPLKQDMPGFRAWDDKLTQMIFERYGVDYSLMPDFTENFDRRISVDEMRVLMPATDFALKGEPLGVKIVEMTPRVAFNRCLDRFKSLFPDEWPNQI